MIYVYEVYLMFLALILNIVIHTDSKSELSNTFFGKVKQVSSLIIEEIFQYWPTSIGALFMVLVGKKGYSFTYYTDELSQTSLYVGWLILLLAAFFFYWLI